MNSRPAKGAGIYNAVVIGAGTAGLVTAAGTAGLGGRVALVERNQMGGDCLNFGCIPSKALISSARLIGHIRDAEKWGLEKQEPQFQFAKIFERMRARRAKIAPNDSQERFESLGVDVFRGEARFVSPQEVEVSGQKLRAKNFVIAAGSRAVLPPIEGLRDVPFFTNETIFDQLQTQPESLIVLGAGPIGCELGQVFSRLGVRVTVVHTGTQILMKEDRDVAEFMQRRFEAEGMEFVLGAEPVRARMVGGRAHFEMTTGAPLIADAVLVAAGRIPNVETLNLEAAGVKYSQRGVEVNAFLQTSQPHIYAAGDVAGSFQFTHTADFMARTVIRNLLMPLPFLRQKVDLSVVPWATYTEPEVARVGLNEAGAKKQNVAYDLIRVPLEEVDRAVVEDEDQGFVKVLTRKGGDQILGVTLVGAHAGDLLHEFVLAMKMKIGLGAIASTMHAYPTFAELARKAGDKFNRKRLTPRAKKIFTWLYERARRS